MRANMRAHAQKTSLSSRITGFMPRHCTEVPRLSAGVCHAKSGPSQKWSPSAKSGPIADYFCQPKVAFS